MLSRLLIFTSGRLEASFDDSSGLIIHGPSATYFGARGDRQRFLLECAASAIRGKLVQACEVASRYRVTPCGPHLRFLVAEGKTTEAHYTKITHVRWRREGSRMVSEDEWANMDVRSHRVDIRWRCCVPKDREVVKSKTERGTMRVDIMYRHVDLEQYFPRDWLPECWKTDGAHDAVITKLPLPVEPDVHWEDDDISPVGLYSTGKHELDVIWVPQGTVWARESTFVAWPHDETMFLSTTQGEYWTQYDASGDVYRHFVLPEDSFLHHAVKTFRRCPRRPPVTALAPTPLRVFDREMVVPHVGRFTIYKWGDTEVIRASFVDDTRAEYVVGKPTFTFINSEGRSERTFAVPGDAAQHASTLMKFQTAYKAPPREETDKAMRGIAEAELSRIEALRLKQMTGKLRNEEMLRILDESCKRCTALTAGYIESSPDKNASISNPHKRV